MNEAERGLWEGHCFTSPEVGLDSPHSAPRAIELRRTLFTISDMHRVATLDTLEHRIHRYT